MSVRATCAASPRTPGITGTGRWTAVAAVMAATTVLGGCADQDGTVPVDEVGVGEGHDGPAAEVPLGGEDPTLADDGVDPGRRDDDLVADLEIAAGTDDQEELSAQATLECGEDGARGILWLEGDVAEAACRTLDDALTLAALQAPQDDQVCTEIHGGPEIATIVGIVDGREVDAVIRRDDGCGVERWDALAPLLPDPGDLGAVR